MTDTPDTSSPEGPKPKGPKHSVDAKDTLSAFSPSLLFILRPVATSLFMAAIFYGIARLNRAGALWLDRQLEQARTLD